MHRLALALAALAPLAAAAQPPALPTLRPVPAWAAQPAHETCGQPPAALTAFLTREVAPTDSAPGRRLQLAARPAEWPARAYLVLDVGSVRPDGQARRLCVGWLQRVAPAGAPVRYDVHQPAATVGRYTVAGRVAPDVAVQHVDALLAHVLRVAVPPER